MLHNPALPTAALENSGTGTLTNAGTIITIDVRGMATLTAQFFGSAISQRIDFRASHDWPTENDLVGAVLLGFGGGPWTFIDPAIFYDGAIYVLPVAGLNEVRLVPVGALGTTLTVHWRLSPWPNAVNVASFVSPPYWNLGLSTTLPADPYEATTLDYINPLVQRVVPYVWNGSVPVIWTGNPATSFGKTALSFPLAQGAAGTTVIAAASVGNKHKIVGAVLTLDAGGTVKFIDGAGDLTGPMTVATDSGFVLPAQVMPMIETSVTNSALSIVTTGGAANGIIRYLTEP